MRITEHQVIAEDISRRTDKIEPQRQDHISDNTIRLSTQLDPECTHTSPTAPWKWHKENSPHRGTDALKREAMLNAK